MINEIKVGTVITLTDPTTIESMMDENMGDFTNGLDLTVESVVTVEALDHSSTKYIYEFEEDINVFLMITDIGGVKDHDFKVFFKVPEFEEGTRQDMLDNGLLFVFNEPEGEDWTPAELDLTKVWIIDEETIERKQTTFAKYNQSPAVENMDYPLFSSVTEYEVDMEDKGVNPFFMLLESGGMDEDDNPLPQGGWVELYRGRTMKEFDLEVL
jgi:hypothetical protein